MTGFGEFTSDSQAYSIDVAPEHPTPAPWINVICNERFGCLLSERGSGYTWSENSRENRLTPWSNDAVSDPSGEIVYLSDESGKLWSPTPQPFNEGAYRVTHRFGYSTFETRRDDIDSTLAVFVAPADPVKVYHLHLRNESDQPRHLTATFYVEWVLGVFRDAMAPFIITSYDDVGALFAHNPYSIEFAERVAFAAASPAADAWTCDRTEFLGRNGDTNHPAALELLTRLQERAGAGMDPCAVLQCHIDLPPHSERDIVFLLGQAGSQVEARALITRYREPEAVVEARNRVTQEWEQVLGAVQVETPDRRLNTLLNGWLLYQTLACRYWARSAFYQPGGAYGFRDQLQDVMAFALAAPHLTREHILRAARHQFTEGDVLHWWHPPTSRGVRTRCSDDYLWLPFVTQHYVRVTGDAAILDEVLPFMEGRALEPSEQEYYGQPDVSQETATLYEHCCRAIENGLRFGAHGLPLMGSGDWNDGMNSVGDEGKGESVWVGQFLYLNLMQMANLTETRGDTQRAARYRDEAKRLQQALEQHTWDGAWYLRAFYDDETPLGSSQGEECCIDSLTQSWAVISGAAPPDRARQALVSAWTHLVDIDTRLVKLFAPPFDHAVPNPGYIAGYVPGVRENGGQYTHAGIWLAWAHALLGDGERLGTLVTMLNPLIHAEANLDGYEVEPYVIAADVYASPTHLGRGGWTWYTGSAAWFYRLGVEMLLGLRREGDTRALAPCIPPAWPGYTLRYRYGSAEYRIEVQNPHGATGGVASLVVDGQVVTDGRIHLVDDKSVHVVHATLGRAQNADSQ
ncbi:MAG: hypothetical protein U0822_06285 [Anaerolineae bacterium]